MTQTLWIFGLIEAVVVIVGVVAIVRQSRINARLLEDHVELSRRVADGALTASLAAASAEVIAAVAALLRDRDAA